MNDFWLGCLLVPTVLLNECSAGNDGEQTLLSDQSSANRLHSVSFESSFPAEVTSKETENSFDGADSGYMQNYAQKKKYGQQKMLQSVKTAIQFPIEDEHNFREIAEQLPDGVTAQRQRDLLIGLPDLSDPCFRVYNDCIVVNAQPYERRSTIELKQCKQRCMHSQAGIYSCRSLVYDTANKICDLFAHHGDQLPSELLKYQDHLYLEPTFADGCIMIYGKKSKKAITSAESLSIASIPGNGNLDEESGDKPENCEVGTVVGYLRTYGFELDSTERMDLKAYSLDACTDACTKNSDGKGHNFGCRSFDYREGNCKLSAEAAAPLGTGQLKQNDEANYYEKYCIADHLLSSECRIINRFPQMILVGFAETVVTEQSFTECFENCLKSRQLFGMNCTSAMYFYEEIDQNCILNRENRLTKKNLFVSENADIVDYFEINCSLRERNKFVKNNFPLKS